MPKSEMHQRVEAIVPDIPFGHVASYGDIAALAGYPGAARRVGSIARTSTANVPWHRVVYADGRLATVPLAPDNWQQDALAAEGVIVRDGRVVDFHHLRFVVFGNVTRLG